MTNCKTYPILIIALLVVCLPVFAADSVDGAAAKGLEIAIESKARDLGWKDSQGNLKMILKNQHGQTSTRELHIKTLEQENDGDKALTVFDSPKDVKGTSFLSFSHANVDDEQWLYLPALKRVKRISSRNKTGSFMGSEFSFEDMTSFEVEKFDYSYLRDEMVDGQDCYVLDNFPKDKNSGYSHRVTYTDKNEYRLRKVEFYDRKNELLKTLTMSNFTLHKDKYWRPGELHMVNHQSGKSTELSWDAYEIGVNLDENDFNKNALKRAR